MHRYIGTYVDKTKRNLCMGPRRKTPSSNPVGVFHFWTRACSVRCGRITSLRKTTGATHPQHLHRAICLSANGLCDLLTRQGSVFFLFSRQRSTPQSTPPHGKDTLSTPRVSVTHRYMHSAAKHTPPLHFLRCLSVGYETSTAHGPCTH